MSTTGKILLYLIPLAYVFMKFGFTYDWWFSGTYLWDKAFKPLPSDDYGYLLGNKWIGTRNLMHGAVILFAVLLYRPVFVCWLMLTGILVEFFDGFWLAYGKFVAGWSTPSTDFYMIGAFVWLPVLGLATYLWALRAKQARDDSTS